MYCYLHPNRPAVGACVRCGNLVCEVCDVLAGGRHYCKACLQRMEPGALFGLRRFARARRDRVLAGVCGGLARYFGIDANLVRLLFALGTFFTGIVPFTIAYVVLAVIIPEEE